VIEHVDELLETWVKDELGDVDFTLAPPDRALGNRVVSCYLYGLAHKPPLRTQERPPLQLALRYLITAFADDPHEAHSLLGQLAFSAMRRPEWELELDALSPDYWEALHLPPLPCFVLSVPLRQERAEAPVRRVLQPLEIQVAPVTSLHGILLGPGDIPLPNASVMLLSPQIWTMTDQEGHFAFPAIPAESGSRHLRVRAKGKEFELEVEQPAAGEQPVTVHVNAFD